MAVEDGVGDVPRQLYPNHVPGGMYSFEALEEGEDGLLSVQDDEVTGEAAGSRDWLRLTCSTQRARSAIWILQWACIAGTTWFA